MRRKIEGKERKREKRNQNVIVSTFFHIKFFTLDYFVFQYFFHLVRLFSIIYFHTHTHIYNFILVCIYTQLRNYRNNAKITDFFN